MTKDDNNKSTPTTSESSSVIGKDEIANRGMSKNGAQHEEIAAEIQSFKKLPFSFQNELRMGWTIVMFFTLLPVPNNNSLHPGWLMKGMVYVPLVGMWMGMIVATVFDVTTVVLGLPSVIGAAISTAVGWYWTGCLHEDGLSDSADGIGGGWTRSQIFKIMSDSRVGVYGSAVLTLYIITKVQLLAALGRSEWSFHLTSAAHDHVPSQGAGPALIVAHTMARVTAPYLIHSFDYVDDEQGPKSSFYAFMKEAKHLISWPRKLVAIGFAMIVTGVMHGPGVAGLLMVMTLCFAEFAGRYGNDKLGGIMGDFLGGTICVCELMILAMLIIVQQRDEEQPWTVVYWWLRGNWEQYRAGTELGELIVVVFQDSRIAAMMRFVICFGLLKAWGAIVTASKSSSNKENQTETNIKSSKTKDGSSKNPDNSKAVADATPKTEAAMLLSLSTSTFRERYDAVQTYMDALAKPVGSLGTLEAWGARLAALQRTLNPTAKNVMCLIFAGDHGAAAAPQDGGEGCSAYPQAVTQAVLVGLERGVAGASVLARANNVELRVIDVGVILGGDNPFKNGKNVVSSPRKLSKGTRNFCTEPAMSPEECQRCMAVGRDTLVQSTEESSSKVVALGEVGIGNTTSSSALIAALTQQSAEELCGGGAFATRDFPEDVISKKINIVKRALTKHFNGNSSIQAADALAKLGGAEIAAIVGALLEASDRDVAVLVDGFIATAAALVAVCISPNVCHVLFFTSHSAEPGQRAAIEKIKAIAEANNLPVDESPALSMHLRMGEATAALLAVPILRSSAEVLADMATIQDILSSRN